MTDIEYRKQYYAKNQEKIKNRMYEKLQCPCCESIVSRCNFPKHQRTKTCVSKKENSKVGKIVNEFIKLKNEPDRYIDLMPNHLRTNRNSTICHID